MKTLNEADYWNDDVVLKRILADVAELVDPDYKYKVIFGSMRKKSFLAEAYTTEFIRGGQRKIGFSPRYVARASLWALEGTMLHEIAHFKHDEKFRRLYRQASMLKIPHFREHSKRFWKIVEALEGKLHQKRERIWEDSKI